MNGVTGPEPPGPVKYEMATRLGGEELLLPARLNRALAANDRAKYLMALLQTAREQADDPYRPGSSLREERIAAGVADTGLDSVTGQSSVAGPGLYAIPRAARIHAELLEAVRQMLAPLPSERAGREQLERIESEAPDLTGDVVPGAWIDRITSAATGPDGSLHQLIMTTHRALNRALAAIATEEVSGAVVYGLNRTDRHLVKAFMAGVGSTAPLKFDHPGLATTATRAGDRLIIQNDLGTTRAHVVVITVEGSTVTVSYSDVHRRRLRFFTSLLEPAGVGWSGGGSRQGGPALGSYQVAVGSAVAADQAGLVDILRFIGSRLVFVLDWNRARKRLETFLPPAEAEGLLRWAADRDIGHMGFLMLGGPRLLYDAVELSANLPARYGEPLLDVLGRDATLAVTRFAMSAATGGLLAGKSALLIRDEIRVEVLRHVQASHQRLLDSSAAHASLIVECAGVLHAALSRLGADDGRGFLERAAIRAAGWEHRADQVLLDQRQASQRVEGGRTVTALTTAADDAIDALEEAVFLLTLLPDEAAGVVRPILDPVAAIAVATAREHLKAVEIARVVMDGSSGEDLEDFLVAVDQVAGLEHAADDADRAARAGLVRQAPDFRALYVADSICRSTEEATDALLRSALGLRDHALAVLASR